MAAALAVTPASGSIKAAKDFVRVDVTGGDETVVCRIEAAGETTTLVSHVFAPSDAGKHTWDNVMFPSAGSWTVKLLRDSDDFELATLAVTVS